MSIRTWFGEMPTPSLKYLFLEAGTATDGVKGKWGRVNTNPFRMKFLSLSFCGNGLVITM
jgi:hypothetical protein